MGFGTQEITSMHGYESLCASSIGDTPHNQTPFALSMMRDRGVEVSEFSPSSGSAFNAPSYSPKL